MKRLFLGLLCCYMLTSCTGQSGDTGDAPFPSQSTPAIQLDNREIEFTGELSSQVVIITPETREIIHSPVVLSGEAPGTWFFEGSAPVVIVDWDGLIIGEGLVTADAWMTEAMVPFTGVIVFTVDPDAYNDWGWIILQRDNPSGLPEHDAAVEIPVILK